MVDWEQRYREGDTPWEKGAPAPPLRAWLSRHSMPGRILVPGCGTGEDVRLLAEKGAEKVVGLDIAEAPLRRARKFQRTGNEVYHRGDIRSLDPQWVGQFDWVFEHTCFCALEIEDRPAYVRGIAEALTPGGKCFAIFFPFTGNPPGEGPPYSISLEELDHTLSKAFTLLQRWVPSVGYPGRVGNEECRILQKKNR